MFGGVPWAAFVLFPLCNINTGYSSIYGEWDHRGSVTLGVSRGGVSRRAERRELLAADQRARDRAGERVARNANV